MRSMSLSPGSFVSTREVSTQNHVIFLFAMFIALAILSWPILFSMELWIFRDRDSLLNLDYLIDKDHRIGVDIGYAYGLLPLLLQRIAFSVFGRGYWPMIGFIIATWGLMAVFWASVVRDIRRTDTRDTRIWLLVVVALSPLIIIINPNFPYSLLQLSILYSLLLVLHGRRDLALATAVAGCFVIPSLPLVQAALLGGMILLDLHRRGRLSPRSVWLAFAPAVAVASLMLITLVYVFGLSSVLATVLPFQGMRIYRALEWGFMSSFFEFLWPAGRGLGYIVKYYALSPVLWWLFSSGLLLRLAFQAVRSSLRQGLAPWQEVVALAAMLHVAFILFAYGHPDQHILYDPMLAMGVIVGMAHLGNARRRHILLGVFVALSVLSSGRQLNATWKAWTTTSVSAPTAGLYASQDLASDWQRILNLASNSNVYLVSYATGVSHYYPSINSAESWILLPGVLYPMERDRLFESIAAAEFVVEENAMLLPDVRRVLDRMCLSETLVNFRIWRNPARGAGCPSA